MNAAQGHPFSSIKFKKIKCLGRKSLAIFSALALVHAEFSTLWAESSFWQERRQAARRVQAPVPLASPSLPLSGAATQETPEVLSLPPTVTLDPHKSQSLSPSVISGRQDGPEGLASLVLPYGTIDQIYKAPQVGAPLVIILQDAHGVLEAQENMAALLQALQKTNGVKLIGVEGARGKFSLDPYRAAVEGDSALKIAHYMLRQGYIGAPEYAGLTAPLTLWGVEDAALYERHAQTLRQALARKTVLAEHTAEARSSAEKLKAMVYSPALLAFDRRVSAYARGQVGMADYAAVLLSAGISAADYPHLKRLKQALDLESALDFKAVEAARLRLAKALTEKLSPAELEGFVQQSLACRDGRLGYGAYHQGLRALCRRKEISLHSYGPLNAYIDYVSLSDAIDRRGLLEEMARAQAAAQKALAKTAEEKRLLVLDRRLSLLEKLAGLRMTPDDWRDYQADRREILRAPGELAKRGAKTKSPWDNAADSLAPFEGFCRLAEERNTALLQNLLAKMEKDKARTAVLVAGGFHSRGLTELLREQGASFATVLPKITQPPVEENYLDIFARDPLPLEKLFSNEKISLVRALGLADRAPAGFTLWSQRVKEIYFLLGAAFGRRPAQAAKAAQAAGLHVDVLEDEQNGSSRRLKIEVGEGLYQADVVAGERLSLKRLSSLPMAPQIMTAFRQAWAALQTGLLRASSSLLYKTVGVNWETVFQMPAYVAVTFLPGFLGLLVGVVFALSMSFVFAARHEKGRPAAFAVGLALNAVVLIPGIVQSFGASLPAWLADPDGSLWRVMASHTTYNTLALIFGWPLASILKTPAVNDGVPALLNVRRSLAFTDNADALDRHLSEEARRKRLSYLRVTLRDPSDLDRLMSQAELRRGHLSTKEGPLPRMIRQGGVLLVDYNGSDPKLVEGLNSLFDRQPHFRGQKASDELSVVGVMSDAGSQRYPASFYSRFQQIATLKPSYSDPINTIPGPPANFNGVAVELFEAPETRPLLAGRYYLDEKGAPRVEEGALIRALREKKPLLIRGGDWEKSDAAHLIRQALLHRAVEFNGKRYRLPPDFHIYREPGRYDEKAPEKKRLLGLGESTGDEVWVVNEETQDALFSFTHVDARGRLIQRPGLLERPRLHLRVTSPLADWVWHRIFHASGEIDIEIPPGLPLPATYARLASPSVKTAVAPRAEPLAQALAHKGVYVEGEDLSLIRGEIQRAHAGRNVAVFSVTPDTTMDQITASLEMETTPQNRRLFRSERRGLLTALAQGSVLVLEGVDINPSLLRQLETALQEKPYLMENGERRELAAWPGQLILTAKPRPGLLRSAAHRAVLPPSRDRWAAILAQEFPDRFQQDEFEKILLFGRLIDNLPVPDKARLYPHQMPLTLSRLRLLYRQRNWLEGLENVFLVHYREAPEVEAYLRTMVRLLFNLEEPGRRPRTLHGPRLKEVLNKSYDTIPWRRHFWQFADTLSLDLLKEVAPGLEFRQPKTEAALALVRSALAQEDRGPEWEDFVKTYHGPISATDARIDQETRAGMETWQERKERVIRALERGRAVMLKGSPGTGKSFITNELAREMGYANGEVVGPVTAGSDTHEADVVVRRVYEEGRTQALEESIARWARHRRGGLLIVDEANLTNPAFWRFLQGLFAEEPSVWINGRRQVLTVRHKVIFTGNQETLAGRNHQDLIQNEVATVYFPEFGPAFLRSQIEAALASGKHRRRELVDLILSLHEMFRQAGPDKGFSLRDVQELCARVNVFTGEEWDVHQVAPLAWTQYRGVFDEEERVALEFLMGLKHNVFIRESEADVFEAFWQAHGAAFEKADISLVYCILHLATGVADFLRLREARLAGATRLQGKRGMIVEGPSGRGKDITILEVLRGAGLMDAKTAPRGTPPTRLYYQLNASLDFDELTRTIRKAQEEGSMVVVSELNLLPSGLLEGKLNDVLTGKAEEGFAVMATINSVDFSGREKLSTALQNRVIYERLEDYTEPELMVLANDTLSRLPDPHGLGEDDLRHMVKAHLWVRDHVSHPQHRPTTRELQQVVKRSASLVSKGSSVQEVIRQVYGPFYIQHAIKRPLPARARLSAYEPKKLTDNAAVLRRIAEAIIPAAAGPVKIKLDAATTQGAYHTASDNSITLHADSVEDGTWRERLLHEASHGRSTRTMPALRLPSAMDELYQDMEDVRHTAGFDAEFPSGRTSMPSYDELRFARLVNELNTGELLHWMDAEQGPGRLTLRHMFRYALVTHGKRLVSRQNLAAMAEVIDGVFEVNPIKMALPHLDRAAEIVAARAPVGVWDEEEKKFQQYRALVRMRAMVADYGRIPDEHEDPPDVPLAAQKEALARGLDQLAKADLKPQAGPSPATHVPRAPPSAEEIARKKLEMEDRRRLQEEAARKRKEALRKAVTDEMDLMEEDLASPRGVLQERLDEMWTQLTHESHPISLLPLLQQLDEPALTQRSEALKEKITRFKARALPIGQAQPRSGFNLRPRSWDPDFSPVFQRPPVGRRYKEEQDPFGTGAVHNKERPNRKNPYEIGPPLPRPFPGPARLPSARDERLAGFSGRAHDALETALEAFVSHRLQPDKIYGREGALDVERFITGDPTTAFLRSGGRQEKIPRTLVLTDLPAHPNPVLAELLHFLHDQGFPIHATSQAPTVDELRLWRREKDMEVISAQDLQKRVEALYLDAAFRAAAAGAAEETAKSHDPSIQPEEERHANVPDLYKTPPEELSLQEQNDLARGMFKQLGYKAVHPAKFQPAGPGQGMTLDLGPDPALSLPMPSDFPITISRLTSLEGLFYNDESLEDLDFVKPLSRLQRLQVVAGEKLQDISGLKNLTELKELMLVAGHKVDFSALNDRALDRLTLFGEGMPDSVGSLGNARIGSLLLEKWPSNRDALNGKNIQRLLVSHETDTPDMTVYTLFREHPDPENFQVRLGGRMYTYKDMPATYKVSKRPLTFQEQVEDAREWLRENGHVAEDCLKVNEDSQEFAIVLNDIMFPDWDKLIQYSVMNELHLSGTLTDDFSPLRGFSGLEALNLANHPRLRDISFIEGLKRISILRLDHTSIENISVLRGLPNLVSFSASNTPLSDITPLYGMDSLKYANLGGTTVPDEQIFTLFQRHSFPKRLVVVNPKGDPIGYKDIPPEYRPPEEMSLDQQIAAAKTFVAESFYEEQDATFKVEANQTFELRLVGDLPIDLGRLREWTRLSALEVNSDHARDLHPIRDVKRLTHLALHGKHAPDLSALAGLTDLESLVIAYDEWVDLTPLYGLPLYTLDLQDTPIPLDDIYAFFRNHPGPQDLVVQYITQDGSAATLAYKDVPGPPEYKPMTAFSSLPAADGAAAPVVSLDASSRQFLARVVESLVDRQAAMAQVRQRFQEEGQEKQFDDILAALEEVPGTLGDWEFLANRWPWLNWRILGGVEGVLLAAAFLLSLWVLAMAPVNVANALPLTFTGMQLLPAVGVLVLFHAGLAFWHWARGVLLFNPLTGSYQAVRFHRSLAWRAANTASWSFWGALPFFMASVLVPGAFFPLALAGILAGGLAHAWRNPANPRGRRRSSEEPSKWKSRPSRVTESRQPLSALSDVLLLGPARRVGFDVTYRVRTGDLPNAQEREALDSLVAGYSKETVSVRLSPAPEVEAVLASPAIFPPSALARLGRQAAADQALAQEIRRQAWAQAERRDGMSLEHMAALAAMLRIAGGSLARPRRWLLWNEPIQMAQRRDMDLLVRLAMAAAGGEERTDKRAATQVKWMLRNYSAVLRAAAGHEALVREGERLLPQDPLGVLMFDMSGFAQWKKADQNDMLSLLAGAGGFSQNDTAPRVLLVSSKTGFAGPDLWKEILQRDPALSAFSKNILALSARDVPGLTRNGPRIVVKSVLAHLRQGGRPVGALRAVALSGDNLDSSGMAEEDRQIFSIVLLKDITTRIQSALETLRFISVQA